jgi:hypothetical protein
MNIAMATKIPKKAKMKPGESTDFQLHKSQLTIFSGILHMVFDYTEHKLRKHINIVKDEQQKLTLRELLKDYITGNVAVAWKKGQPIWIKVSKD